MYECALVWRQECVMCSVLSILQLIGIYKRIRAPSLSVCVSHYKEACPVSDIPQRKWLSLTIWLFVFSCRRLDSCVKTQPDEIFSQKLEQKWKQSCVKVRWAYSNMLFVSFMWCTVFVSFTQKHTLQCGYLSMSSKWSHVVMISYNSLPAFVAIYCLIN